MDVWVLWHIPKEPDESDAMLIGLYSSRDAALQAVDRLSGKPGFRDNPMLTDDAGTPGFFTEPYPVDEDQWTEGYRHGGETITIVDEPG